MELMFKWQDIGKRQKGLTYDDVLLVPSFSEVRSRRDPQLETQLTKARKIQVPLISANMDTITEAPMAIAMGELGGLGIIHRFMSVEQQLQQVKLTKASVSKVISASIGTNEEDRSRADALVEAGVEILTIDVAHGHSLQMKETIEWCKKRFKNVEVIAGNVASPKAVSDIADWGADAIKVGIGPGSMCTTRVITGCGVPQLTAVATCVEVAKKRGIPVIADGGLKNSGDIVKALAAGASTVMLGSMLSGTIETPGEIRNGRKMYRGMASRSAQNSWRGGVPQGMAPEGESTSVWVKGHVKDVVFEILGGIRSGMSYMNASTINEIAENAHFMEITSAGFGESIAHGLHSNR